MEDLTGQINAILSDPQAMEQIKGLAASLGLQGTPECGVETQLSLIHIYAGAGWNFYPVCRYSERCFYGRSCKDP